MTLLLIYLMTIFLVIAIQTANPFIILGIGVAIAVQALIGDPNVSDR